MENIVVLGSTGSIGRNTLDIISRTDRFRVVGLSCNTNIDELSKQVKQFRPRYVCVANRDAAKKLRERFSGLEVLDAEDGLIELVSLDEVDFVVNALVGSSGVLPTYYAVKSKKKFALANKESLVVAGKLIKGLACRLGVEIVPIDSEHSAIYQCLEKSDIMDVEKIIITASGGPFLNKDFSVVTPKDALKHPNWNMGKKITVDSATMMNKGFEVIEAHWLFNIEPEKIEILIHPESIVHSAVEFVDGSIIAQIANHDMRIPIAYALFKPKRINLPFKLDLAKIGRLNFQKPDFKRFPTLGWAFEALSKESKNLGMVLNIADEIAVEEFLNGKIKFVDIFSILELSLKKFEDDLPENIHDIKKMMDYLKAEAAKLIEKDYRRL